MSVIEDLKNNEKAFDFMTAEMQEKAKDIGYHEFDCHLVQAGVKWTRVTSGVGAFEDIRTYRLRPDYSEEPEIVEYEFAYKVIDGGFKIEGYFYEDGQFHPLTHIPDGYVRVGFKYVNGAITAREMVYTNEVVTKETMVADDLKTYEVLTPSHVVFKKIR